ncbi:MAG: serine/threonine protein kinase, partial [Paracoccaceae bacterium]|nr:serine/threonine protein kinase [Paracoccaceae bacterium]
MAMEQPAEEPREFVDELKPGTKLLQGQYTIVKFINAGGFGITYLAKNSLEREVVIKECFPGSFCRRSQGTVAARSRSHEAEFAQIVKLFVQEAKSLSRLIHPNIVGVHQVFEDNATAYMAIDYIQGRDLLDIIEHDRLLLKPQVVVMMLKKLLGAVAFIHDNGMLHRDISPDNILISRAGDPILIDFGAARQQATRIGGKALSALRVVKDGYSPQEFYVSGTQQSPSSDLYALAATFYHLISGEAPPNSQARLVAIAENDEDPYLPLAGRFEGYPQGFLEAIDDAVSVLPKDRIQTAREWLDRIAQRPELKVVPLPGRAGEPAASEAAASLAPEALAAEPAAGPRRSLGGTLALALGFSAIAGAAGYVILEGWPEGAPVAAEESATLAPAPVAPEPERAAPEAATAPPPRAAIP